MSNEDDKLYELRDILMGTKTGKVVPLGPRTMVAARAVCRASFGRTSTP
jgi:hypothetical protein